MGNKITILKREIRSEDIILINNLIEDYGHKGRAFISKELYKIWDWRKPNGQYRDIICRDLLRRLDKRKFIQLPPPMQAARKPGYRNNPILPKDFNPSPLSCKLKDFAQIEIILINSKDNKFRVNLWFLLSQGKVN